MPRPSATLLLLALTASCRTPLLDLECDPTSPCPPIDDPCRSAVCSPAGRCERRPLPEGQACGEVSDCRIAHACRAGACVQIPAGDGMVCAPATPCRAAGVCVGGACVAPPAAPFAVPLWSAGRAGTRHSPIAVDGAGNFYWQECAPDSGCSSGRLISVDGAGRERFDVAVGGPSAPVIVGDTVVRAVPCYREGAVVRDGHIEARRGSDGAPRWLVSTADLVPAPPPTSCRSVASDLVLDGTTLYALGGIAPTNSVRGAATLLAIDATSGQARAVRRWDGYWIWSGTQALVGDGAGTVVLRVDNDGLAVAQGVERWRAPSLDFVAAAAEGTIWSASFVTGDGKMHFVFEAFDGATGRHRYQLAPRQLRAMPLVAPVFAPGAGYAFDAGNDYVTGEALVAFDPGSGAERWRLPLALDGRTAAGSDLLLTARRSLLFWQREFSTCDDQRCAWESAHLREVTASGRPLWSCALPLAEVRQHGLDSAGTLALGRGVLAVGGADGLVRGYALPGALPALRGWIGARGTMQRSGRPLP